MFFTFEQEGYQRHREIERFVVIEADNETEARERATYFGIDFDEELSSSGDKRWWEDRDGGWGRPEPLIMGYRIIRYTNNGGWVILYKNDCMSSSRAVDLDDEYDPYETPDSEDGYDSNENTTFAVAT